MLSVLGVIFPVGTVLHHVFACCFLCGCLLLFSVCSSVEVALWLESMYSPSQMAFSLSHFRAGLSHTSVGCLNSLLQSPWSQAASSILFPPPSCTLRRKNISTLLNVLLPPPASTRNHSPPPGIFLAHRNAARPIFPLRHLDSQ